MGCPGESGVGCCVFSLRVLVCVFLFVRMIHSCAATQGLARLLFLIVVTERSMGVSLSRWRISVFGCLSGLTQAPTIAELPVYCDR